MPVPRILRQRRAAQPVKFITASEFFRPQAQVLIKRDVSGWADRKRKIKWSLSAGQIVMLDIDKAAEFIVKGYAEGELPRPVSDNEKAEWRSQVQTITLGEPNG